MLWWGEGDGQDLNLGGSIMYIYWIKKNEEEKEEEETKKKNVTPSIKPLCLQILLLNPKTPNWQQSV